MITNETVAHLAQLARISISDSEKESLKKDLESILAYVEDISSLETEDSRNSASQGIEKNIVRNDEITNTAGEYTDSLVALAPKKEDDYFTVKKILSHND
jgi:aspartyl-tRNA(Asn)/glutamyl-tRNA(Gln) amidotransferase subunit C